jgi:tRNA1Val (adenine37-N6)-methyltransferase
MSNPYFRFKQFIVYHDLCAMKVGVDGVLLGAWADCRNVQFALDVGTGSGLIALMLAQRSKARVHAIDIDENACKQAEINFNNSPFHDRLSIERIAFQNFSSSVRYDLIVSNPPYFTQSLQSPDTNRSLARHNEYLPLEVLIKKSASLLSPQGKVAFILPFDRWEKAHTLAVENQLFLCRKTFVSSLQNHPPKRVLLEYSFIDQGITEEDSFYIGNTKQTYSPEYRALTEDFYL